jgi:hypothetical protein
LTMMRSLSWTTAVVTASAVLLLLLLSSSCAPLVQAFAGVSGPSSRRSSPSTSSSSSSFQPHNRVTTTGGGSGGGVALYAITAQEAIARMDTSQAESVKTIESAMPGLLKRPDLSWTAAENVLIAGCLATLDGREAPGADGNVAWMSNLCVASKISALTIFNGPLTTVPHLVSSCAVISPTQLTWTLDFRPRGYGAYELRDAEGNYPGPDQLGRDAFTYSGNRREYDTKFGTPAVVEFLQSTVARLEGAIPNTNTKPLTELELLTRGPLCIDVTLPLTEANVATITAARAQAVNYWLTWATVEKSAHAHRPGAPINAQYVYDSKFKINSYGALLNVYSGIFGATEGATLAAADLGPLDEAYVGGGS